MYTTIQPELENQKAERLGETPNRSPPGDKVISEAIRSDFKEAKEQVTGTEPGGFAWGFRQMIFGKREDGSSPKSSGVAPATEIAEQDKDKAQNDR